MAYRTILPCGSAQIMKRMPGRDWTHTTANQSEERAPISDNYFLHEWL